MPNDRANMKYQELKEDVIRMARSALAQIPYNTVDNYQNDLFKLNTGESPEKQINFLKDVQLLDLTYSNTRQRYFTMGKRGTTESIQVDNRQPMYELRGILLRNFLNQEKKETPQESVFDAITRGIKDPKYSDVYQSLKKYACGINAASTYGRPMSEAHFDLFATKLLEHVQGKIRDGALENDLSPADIRNTPGLQDKIWEGIDISKVFEDSFLSAHFQAIKTVSEDLKKRGHINAADIALTLYNNLTNLQNAYIHDQILPHEFIDKCTLLLETAQHNELLQNHLGLVNSIFHAILVALNNITLGAVSIKATKSVQASIKIQEALHFFTTKSNETCAGELTYSPTISEDLRKRGYFEAADVFSKLRHDLCLQQVEYVIGKLSLEKFQKNVLELIDKAEKHLNNFQTLFRGIRREFYLEVPKPGSTPKALEVPETHSMTPDLS